MNIRKPQSWIAAAMLVIVAAACSTDVEIQSATASGDGMNLGLSLNSCNRTYNVAVEEEDVVNVKVTDAKSQSPIRLGGEDCADQFGVTLREPLGDRAVVDMATGDEVEVTYEPWNQQRFTEDEYRAALEATAECIVAADLTALAVVRESVEGPYLDVELRDLGDGESGINPEYKCSIDHLDPLRR